MPRFWTRNPSDSRVSCVCSKTTTPRPFSTSGKSVCSQSSRVSVSRPTAIGPPILSNSSFPTRRYGIFKRLKFSCVSPFGSYSTTSRRGFATGATTLNTRRSSVFEPSVNATSATSSTSPASLGSPKLKGESTRRPGSTVASPEPAAISLPAFSAFHCQVAVIASEWSLMSTSR